MRHAPSSLVLILLAALVALGGCRAETTTADADAEAAHQPDTPRIVSLSPALSIILADLGLATRIVGRHGFDRTLDPALPIVGDQTGVDYETLARLDPTHVLIEQGADEPPAMLATLASERGWTVIARPMLALDDIPAAVDAIAEAFTNEPGVRDRHADLRDRFGRAWAHDDTVARRFGRTLVVYWTSPIGVAGPGSFHHDLLARLGVEALPQAGGPYQTLDAEDLRRLAPESVLLLSPDISDDAAASVRELWTKWEIPAALHSRITVIRRWTFLTPSTSMIELAEELRRLADEHPAAGDSST